jgi:hypothetical protein
LGFGSNHVAPTVIDISGGGIFYFPFVLSQVSLAGEDSALAGFLVIRINGGKIVTPTKKIIRATIAVHLPASLVRYSRDAATSTAAIAEPTSIFLL